MTTLANVNTSMMERSVATSGSTPSVLSEIHKLRVYNPNGFKWEEMDKNKAGKLILTIAGTKDEVLIDPPKVNILAHYKRIEWEVSMLDSLWDTIILPDWNQDTRFFYSSQFHPKAPNATTVIWFTAKGMNPSFFTKESLLLMAKTPNVNGLPNPFFEWKKNAEGQKYKTTLLNNVDYVYWVFVDWDYAWEYFQMKIKSNALGSDYDYKTASIVQAEEWTLTRVVQDALDWWNEKLESSGYKPVRYITTDLLDLQMKVDTVTGFSGKEHNKLSFEFSGYTADRKEDNIEDVNYINDFNERLYQEAFGKFVSTPLTVEVQWVNAIVNLDLTSPVSVWEVKELFSEEVSEAVKHWAAF